MEINSVTDNITQIITIVGGILGVISVLVIGFVSIRSTRSKELQEISNSLIDVLEKRYEVCKKEFEEFEEKSNIDSVELIRRLKYVSNLIVELEEEIKKIRLTLNGE